MEKNVYKGAEGVDEYNRKKASDKGEFFLTEAEAAYGVENGQLTLVKKAHASKTTKNQEKSG